MKCIFLFLFAFSCLSPLVYAQTSLEDPFAEERPSYLTDLEELGYCVIPQILPLDETERYKQRVWHEFIEKAWPNCRMDDRSNWKEAFPGHNKYGVLAGFAGQIQVMWDLRQDPRIVEVFSKIWNTDDLIVSMDGLSIMCPPEIREGFFEPWPHVDQIASRKQNNNDTPPVNFVSESSLKTKPFTVQGQFLFEDSSDGDGGFYCIPKSHLKFDEFAPTIEAIEALDLPSEERRLLKLDFLQNFFSEDVPYVMKHVTAPPGSLILWDSRTIHWNQHPGKDRLPRDNPKVRMVGYLCYLPKARLTEEGKAARKDAFETGASTGHNAADPTIKRSKERLREGYEQYLEDPSYQQPKIHLTPLGESLLGNGRHQDALGIIRVAL